MVEPRGQRAVVEQRDYRADMESHNSKPEVTTSKTMVYHLAGWWRWRAEESRQR